MFRTNRLNLFAMTIIVMFVAAIVGITLGQGTPAPQDTTKAAATEAHGVTPSQATIIDTFLNSHTGGTIALSEATGEVREFTLEVHQVMAEIAPGVKVEQWAFTLPDGEPSAPGPEIRVQEGDLVRITLKNTHSQPHTLHLHGIISVAQPMDGVPHTSLQVMPGESYTYEFVAANPGTHAYHCHVDTFTHHDYGMYGLLIIEPNDEQVVWHHDYSMVLDEWDSNQSSTVPGHDPTYNYFLINGKAFPSVETFTIPEDEVALIRLVNMGYEPHAMHMHGSNFLVTHKDGYALASPYQADTLNIAPGERYHVLLKGRDGAFPFHDHMLQYVTNNGIYPGGLHTMILGGEPQDANGHVAQPDEQAHAEHAPDGEHAPDAEIAAEDLPLLGDTSMDIVDFAFEQPVIRIKAGSTVTWTNLDEAPHTVTSGKPGDTPNTRAFDSTGMAEGGMQMMMKGDSWSHTFTEAGEFEYYCLPHPNMVARVIVE